MEVSTTGIKIRMNRALSLDEFIQFVGELSNLAGVFVSEIDFPHLAHDDGTPVYTDRQALLDAIDKYIPQEHVIPLKSASLEFGERVTITDAYSLLQQYL